VRIECLTAFLDGRDRFEVGDVRTVDDARAAVFIQHGWAKPEGGAAPAAANGDTALDIHDSTLTSEAVHG
jgi:hypothetical protein